ncbi:MAG: diguanylate cyclase [Campylobacterales bacterium]|nr:diguanylate cyclase [Campylobacterales bacterium]
MIRLHSTIYLFVLFLLLLSGGLFYYIDISKAEQHYMQTKTNIMKLQFLDRDFDSFFYQYALFSNFDKVNSDIKHFEHILQKLKTHLDHLPCDRDNLNAMVNNIEKGFKKRNLAIEDFKSNKATLINSIHFLHDLYATLKDDTAITPSTHYQLQETLFLSIQFVIAKYIQVSDIQAKLQRIQNYGKKHNHAMILTFVHQNSLFLTNITYLKELTHEATKHQITPQLKILGDTIEQRYRQSLSIQKWIALLFFLFGIIILITLILMQIRFLRSKRELQSFKYAVEHSDNTIILTDVDKKITYVNDVFENNSGYTKQEVMGQNPRIFNSGEHDDAYYQELYTKLNRGESWQGEFINKRKDGTLYYEKASIVPIFLDNQLINYLAIKLDITDYIEKNLQLQQASTLFENAEEAIIITNPHNRITKVNKSFCEMYEYHQEEIIGQNPKILSSNQHDKDFYLDMWNAIHTSGLWQGKIYNQSKSGKIIPIWMSIKLIHDKKGNISSYTAIQTNLRELERSQAQANYLAYNDPMCDLPNRVSFDEHLQNYIKQSQIDKRHFALLFIDLNRLKVVNDTLGHTTGDKLLQGISQRLSYTLGKDDYVARWGGDEFVYLLGHIRSQSDAIEKAATLLDVIEQTITVDNRHINITATIGIASYPDNTTNGSDLIKYANSAMYYAKDLGNNNYQLYTESLSQEIQRKLDLEIALQKAIENDELYLLFQPQYDLKTNQIHSVEALVRWQSPQYGAISPIEFIPIAEDAGLIITPPIK